MPVAQQNVRITYRLLPLTLFPDGTASVTVRRGLLYEDGSWEELAVGAKTVIIDNVADVNSILDAPPVEGMTRRDDLSMAVYLYLVSKGEIVGEVS